LTIAATNIAPLSLSPGHAWFQISDGTTTTSYGYYPRVGFDYVFGDPGEVRKDYDKDQHPNPDWKQDIPITKEQYEKLKEFAEKTKDNPPGYDLSGVAGGNCASFVQSATNAAGITEIPNILKSPFPWWLPKFGWYRDAYYEYYRRPEFNREFRGQWNNAKRWQPPRDPIILDLDGNGLETVGLAANVYFDFDADGVLTKTGWAGKNDALLVWDRNANGSIDTGAELFGDFTPLPNGTLAPNGFAALAALDSNGDGVIDASDPAFAELKLWRDASQDGISQGGELISLTDAGIVSLNLANTLKNQRLANGNQLTREGSFTRADGTTSAMGEFKLATDTFDTQFAEQIEVPEALKTLPNVSGAGNVRELQQAAALSESLAGLVAQFQSVTTRAEQKALLDSLITAWADTSGMARSQEERAAGKYRIVYEAFDSEWLWRDNKCANDEAWEMAA
jgi:hypothetical protein